MFPRANYLIATSRLHPGLDGGYTVSVMRRARAFRSHGGADPVLLTVDFSPEYRQSLDGFRRIGLADEHTVLRNLYQEARAGAEWLWAAADPTLLNDSSLNDSSPKIRGSQTAPESPESETSQLLAADTDLDSAGIPWRRTWRSPGTNRIAYTDYLDDHGRTLIRTPYIARADWHRAQDTIMVFRDGEPVGGLCGFGELYRAWIAAVIAQQDPALPTIVISESRQLGELLPPLRSETVKVIHTVHSAHVLPPYRWDSDIDGLWLGWLQRLAEFDAVVWLTKAQQADVARRFGTPTRFAVIPHPAERAPQQPTSRTLSVLPPPAPSPRNENRAVMISRFVALKQVDHAIRAFAEVWRAKPLVRLDIYGDGPLRADLESLITELGVADAVRLLGYQPNAEDELDDAAVLIMCSSYEGQSLVITEALSHGCPVVAYDVNYGPREMVASGVNGYLVTPGSTDALARAIGAVLGDRARVAELNAGALESAETMTVTHSMALWAHLLERVLAG